MSIPPTRTTSGGIRRLYSTLWTHAAGHRGRLVVCLSLLVLAQALRMALPWLFGKSVDALQIAGAQDVGRAASFLLAMFLVAAVAWALHGPARVMERRTALRARESLADRLYAEATALPLRWHERHHSGDTIHRVQTTTAALFGFAQHQFIYLQNAVSLVAPLVALCAVSPPTGLVALAGYGLIGLVLVRFDGVMVRLAREENQASRRYTSALVDCLGNVSTVIALRLHEATRRVVSERHRDVSRPLDRSIVVNEAKWAAVDLLNVFMRSGLVALYVWLAWRDSGVVLVGTAVMIHSYAQTLGSVVGSMAGQYGELVRQQADVSSADEILAGERRRGAAPPIGEGWREIRVEDLCFAHEGAREGAPSLEGVSLTLRRGARVALVGESGSGKSTLLRVLAGLYEPARGRILVDGVARPDLHDLGAVATLVPQDPEVFESTVLLNLTLGVERSAEEVARACDAACFTPVLEGLPDGLHARIAERGGNLSGGQKQRLALARGLLASGEGSLVLLDEPTSSIDPVTEARIYDGVLAALPTACIVSSIHRLHLLPRFDVVVLLEQGRVLDAGTTDELLARQPRFRAMWEGYVGAGAAPPSQRAA